MPVRGDTVTIIYPKGCKEVTEDLTLDELIKRLIVFITITNKHIYFTNKHIYFQHKQLFVDFS